MQEVLHSTEQEPEEWEPKVLASLVVDPLDALFLAEGYLVNLRPSVMSASVVAGLAMGVIVERSALAAVTVITEENVPEDLLKGNRHVASPRQEHLPLVHPTIEYPLAYENPHHNAESTGLVHSLRPCPILMCCFLHPPQSS